MDRYYITFYIKIQAGPRKSAIKYNLYLFLMTCVGVQINKLTMGFYLNLRNIYSFFECDELNLILNYFSYSMDHIHSIVQSYSSTWCTTVLLPQVPRGILAGLAVSSRARPATSHPLSCALDA